MTIQAQPATIYDQICDKIDDLVLSSTHYLAPDNFSIVLLESECKKLMSADAALAYLCLSSVVSLTGDGDAMRRNYENASKLNPEYARSSVSIVSCLANLGYFSQAQAIGIKNSELEKGTYSAFHRTVLRTGAVNTMLERYYKMKELRMEQPVDFPLDLMEKVVAALSKFQISDEYIASLLDLSGEILRKYKLFDANRTIHDFISYIVDCDGNETVSFTLLLKSTPSKVAQANFELAALLAKLDKPIPNVINVCFGAAA